MADIHYICLPFLLRHLSCILTILSDTLFISSTFLINCSFKMMPALYLLSFTPGSNSLLSLLIYLTLLPFHLVSCIQYISILLLSDKSATSLPLPVVTPTFRVPFLYLKVFPHTQRPNSKNSCPIAIEHAIY